MKELTDFLKEFNLQTIISMALIMWYFTRDMKIELKTHIDTLDRDLREMNKELRDMNTRTSRIEGNVYGKEVNQRVKE